MKTARFLQEQPLFGGVGDHAMEAIVPLLREVKFAAGEVIVREGDDSDSMVVISTGSVEVLKAGPAADNVPGKLKPTGSHCWTDGNGPANKCDPGPFNRAIRKQMK
jgi:hypothetical protein